MDRLALAAAEAEQPSPHYRALRIQYSGARDHERHIPRLSEEVAGGDRAEGGAHQLFRGIGHCREPVDHGRPRRACHSFNRA